MIAGMTATDPGHVFVTRGLVERFARDAVIVPTDGVFRVEDWFWPAIGARTDREVMRQEPERWPAKGYGGARSRPGVWFVDVGDRSVRQICRALVACLEDIQAAGLEPSNRRERPLVVLPILGIGEGGRAAGEMIEALLGAAWSVAGRPGGLDIAFAAKDRRAYAAAQHVRRAQRRWHLPQDQLDVAENLGRRAVAGELATFMGAGVSVPAGLPLWSELLSYASRGMTRTEVAGLGPLDLAELVRRRRPAALRRAVRDRCTSRHHALGHALVQSLGCRENVTTNFDTCFEQSDFDGEIVLLADKPTGRDRWLLKMHGSVDDPQSIVLTRGDFARYDKEYRSAGAVLQALVRTRHVLFVGVSMEDDNVLRLLHEVPRAPGETWGTVVYLGEATGKRALYDGELRWVTIAGDTVTEQARTTEIFLDMVGAYSTLDAPWLLDPTFRRMLRPPERRVVRALEKVASQVTDLLRDDPDRWAPVDAALRSAGWRSPGQES